MLKVLKEKTIFKGPLVIEEGTISDEDGNKFKRLRLKRENCSAVLIFNSDSNKIVLVKQFRYPIYSQTPDDILEIAAGKIDKGETPLQAAIRETEEETGYKIQAENIQFLFDCFASPGYSSERFFIFYAVVKNSDKISKGGGLKSENEHTEVIEIDVNEFKELLFKGAVKDAKTYIAGLHFCLIKNV